MAADYFLTDAHRHIPREWSAYELARRTAKAASDVVFSVPFESQTGPAWDAACERCEKAQNQLHDAERAARAAFRRVFA